MRTAASTMRPLSSTSCLCKDPATAVVNIVYVQTPWCRDIHSLFPAPSVEAGGTKDYEMSFPEPFFYFVLHFFFLLSNWCFFFSLSSSSSCSCYLGICPRFPTRRFSHLHPIPPPQCHWGVLVSQRNSDGGEGGIMMTIPSHFLSGWLSVCQ